MSDTTQSVAALLVQQLSEVEGSRSHWERDFDVHSTDLADNVEIVVNTDRVYLSTIQALTRDPGYSFRIATDTWVTAACWMCLNADAGTRRSLRETISPWGGVVTLLANISGRFLSRFQLTGDVRWIRYSLAAIALLGENVDPRDDLLFLGRVHQALEERGIEPRTVFAEFTELSSGQAQDLFARASGDPNFSLDSVLRTK